MQLSIRYRQDTRCSDGHGKPSLPGLVRTKSTVKCTTGDSATCNPKLMYAVIPLLKPEHGKKHRLISKQARGKQDDLNTDSLATRLTQNLENGGRSQSMNSERSMCTHQMPRMLLRRQNGHTRIIQGQNTAEGEASCAPQRMIRGSSQLDGVPRSAGRQNAALKFFFMQRSEGSEQPMNEDPTRHGLNCAALRVEEEQLMRTTSMSFPAHARNQISTTSLHFLSGKL